MKRKKDEEYKESQITTIYIFDFKLYFARKHSLQKRCLYLYTMQFYLHFLCVAEYLKHSNDTAKLNINKYTDYIIIEVYTNRFKYNNADFHSDGLLDNDVRQVLSL